MKPKCKHSYTIGCDGDHGGGRCRGARRRISTCDTILENMEVEGSEVGSKVTSMESLLVLIWNPEISGVQISIGTALYINSVIIVGKRQ